MDPKDRHDLGEFYTPDWLCERMIAELLPSSGFVSVIDPACGCGGFLRAAISHLRRSDAGLSQQKLLQQMLNHVGGIDIHPLASSDVLTPCKACLTSNR